MGTRMTRISAFEMFTLHGALILVAVFPKKDHHTLVGGFNPLEKYESNWIYFPKHRGENSKFLSCHHPVTVLAQPQLSVHSPKSLGPPGSKSKDSNSPLPQPNPPNPSASPPDMAVLGKGGGKRGGAPVTSSPPTKPSTLGWNELKHQVATNDVMRLDYPPGNDHISHPVGQLGRWFSELPQLGYVSFLEGIRFIN